jgi:hypothetical protein
MARSLLSNYRPCIPICTAMHIASSNDTQVSETALVHQTHTSLFTGGEIHKAYLFRVYFSRSNFRFRLLGWAWTSFSTLINLCIVLRFVDQVDMFISFAFEFSSTAEIFAGKEICFFTSSIVLRALQYKELHFMFGYHCWSWCQADGKYELDFDITSPYFRGISVWYLAAPHRRDRFVSSHLQTSD